MRKQYIEGVVKDFHLTIWRNQDALWPGGRPGVIDMLDPYVGCHLLDIAYEEFDSLTSPFSFRGKGFRVAGLMDRHANKIAISNEYSESSKRFTLAHELGHWLLHPGETHHRDRAIDHHADNAGLSLEEREANYFAACYLMPEKLMRTEFEAHFSTKVPFRFNETTAFWLAPAVARSLTCADIGSLDRAFALADNRSYNGRHMKSLAEIFKVSKTAMALRIQELGFIQWP
jgi:Zn-dependent peptidase ImmA (M78 family)